MHHHEVVQLTSERKADSVGGGDGAGSPEL